MGVPVSFFQGTEKNGSTRVYQEGRPGGGWNVAYSGTDVRSAGFRVQESLLWAGHFRKPTFQGRDLAGKKSLFGKQAGDGLRPVCRSSARNRSDAGCGRCPAISNRDEAVLTKRPSRSPPPRRFGAMGLPEEVLPGRDRASKSR